MDGPAVGGAFALYGLRVPRRRVRIALLSAALVAASAWLAAARDAGWKAPAPLVGRYEASGPYLDFDSREPVPARSDVVLEDHGVPLVRYPDAGYQRNPVMVAQHGLQEYSYWLTRRDVNARRRAIRMSRWLVDSLQPDGT